MNNEFSVQKMLARPEEPENDFSATPLDSLPLVMAYVPLQKWRKIYDADVGHERGTIFSELDLPFLGRRATDK